MDSPESKAMRLENVVRCPRIGQPFPDGRVISAAGVRNFLFAQRSRISFAVNASDSLPAL
jgi:hypothetical protein